MSRKRSAAPHLLCQRGRRSNVGAFSLSEDLGRPYFFVLQNYRASAALLNFSSN
jgi:hypothetical protein